MPKFYETLLSTLFMLSKLVSVIVHKLQQRQTILFCSLFFVFFFNLWATVYLCLWLGNIWPHRMTKKPHALDCLFSFIHLKECFTSLNNKEKSVQSDLIHMKMEKSWKLFSFQKRNNDKTWMMGLPGGCCGADSEASVYCIACLDLSLVFGYRFRQVPQWWMHYRSRGQCWRTYWGRVLAWLLRITWSWNTSEQVKREWQRKGFW